MVLVFEALHEAPCGVSDMINADNRGRIRKIMEAAAFEKAVDHSQESNIFFAQIEKRDGRIVPFDAAKITKALLKAGAATGEFNEDTARQLTMRVLGLYQQLNETTVPTVEHIQDVVEEVLLMSPFNLSF